MEREKEHGQLLNCCNLDFCLDESGEHSELFCDQGCYLGHLSLFKIVDFYSSQPWPEISYIFNSPGSVFCCT